MCIKQWLSNIQSGTARNEKFLQELLPGLQGVSKASRIGRSRAGEGNQNVSSHINKLDHTKYASSGTTTKSPSDGPCAFLENADPLAAHRAASTGKLCECFSILVRYILFITLSRETVWYLKRGVQCHDTHLMRPDDSLANFLNRFIKA